MELPSWLTKENIVKALEQTWPAKIAETAVNGFMAPGRALASTEPINTAEMIEPVLGMQTAIGMGGAGARMLGKTLGPDLKEFAMSGMQDTDLNGASTGPMMNALFSHPYSPANNL